MLSFHAKNINLIPAKPKVHVHENYMYYKSKYATRNGKATLCACKFLENLHEKIFLLSECHFKIKTTFPLNVHVHVYVPVINCP